MLYYAGIGSRETPEEFLNFFATTATKLAKQGVTLRSGGAQGADRAFENGCNLINGPKEVFIPWKNFQRDKPFNLRSNLIVSNPTAFELAAKFHPVWHNLKPPVQKLMARNAHQVLGWDLDTFSDFVICWTKNGAMKGGTSQSIRMAEFYDIPVFNAGAYATPDEAAQALTCFLQNFNLTN